MYMYLLKFDQCVIMFVYTSVDCSSQFPGKWSMHLHSFSFKFASVDDMYMYMHMQMYMYVTVYY